jgi:hypothetical protein
MNLAGDSRPAKYLLRDKRTTRAVVPFGGQERVAGPYAKHRTFVDPFNGEM